MLQLRVACATDLSEFSFNGHCSSAIRTPEEPVVIRRTVEARNARPCVFDILLLPTFYTFASWPKQCAAEQSAGACPWRVQAPSRAKAASAARREKIGPEGDLIGRVVASEKPAAHATDKSGQNGTTPKAFARCFRCDKRSLQSERTAARQPKEKGGLMSEKIWNCGLKGAKNIEGEALALSSERSERVERGGPALCCAEPQHASAAIAAIDTLEHCCDAPGDLSAETARVEPIGQTVGAVDVHGKHTGQIKPTSVSGGAQKSEVAPAGRQDLMFLDPQRPWTNGLDWYVIAWLAVIHLGALAAPWFFSWQGLTTFLALTWLTGPLGVCLGYHRLLTHNSFQTYPWVRRTLAALGTLAGEGPPITWVAVHRMHHQHSDRPGDPHSPRDGGWWSHMVWLFPRPKQPQFRAMIDRYGKDLLADPFMRFLDRTFLLWHVALAGGLFGLGWLLWGSAIAWSMLVWGAALRMVYVLHITWLVNSASHMWGYRNFETKDDSRNLWWVGLLAFGEGWHNNHHAFPGRAQHGGYRWWEIDLTYRTICLMEKLGLAWSVVRPRSATNERSRTAHAERASRLAEEKTTACPFDRR